MTSVVELARELGLAVAEHVPFGARTTYRVGGRARFGLTLERPDEVGAVAELVRETGLVVFVLGAGSNVLVADAGFDGLLVDLGPGFRGVEPLEADEVDVGGGAPLPTTARRLAALGRRGFAWAVGVPGTVGGAVRMNAGGHGGDMAGAVRRVLIGDLHRGVLEEWTRAELAFGYRHSAVQPWQVVLRATLALGQGERAAEEQAMKEVVRWRRAHQPGGQNAGSVFTNPVEAPAAKLIDAAGLRGRRLGTAQVSPKHANFIQADPGGSADDVFALLSVVQEEVEQRFGVRLEPEVRLVGFCTSTRRDDGGAGSRDDAVAS